MSVQKKSSASRRELLALLTLAPFAGSLAAQGAWPTKPVRLV